MTTPLLRSTTTGQPDDQPLLRATLRALLACSPATQTTLVDGYPWPGQVSPAPSDLRPLVAPLLDRDPADWSADRWPEQADFTSAVYLLCRGVNPCEAIEIGADLPATDPDIDRVLLALFAGLSSREIVTALRTGVWPDEAGLCVLAALYQST